MRNFPCRLERVRFAIKLTEKHLLFIKIDGMSPGGVDYALQKFPDLPGVRYFHDLIRTEKRIVTVDLLTVSRSGHLVLASGLSAWETNLLGNRVADFEKMCPTSPRIEDFFEIRTIYDAAVDAGYHENLLFANKGLGLSDESLDQLLEDVGDEGGIITNRLEGKIGFYEDTWDFSHSPFKKGAVLLPVLKYMDGKPGKFTKLAQKRNEIRNAVQSGQSVGLQKFITLDNVLAHETTRLLRERQPFLATGTISGLDKAGHSFTVESKEFAEVLSNTGLRIKEMIEALDGETLVAITGDHGNSTTTSTYPIEEGTTRAAERAGLTKDDYVLVTDGREAARIFLRDEVRESSKFKTIVQAFAELETHPDIKWVQTPPPKELIDSAFGRGTLYDPPQFGDIIIMAQDHSGFKEGRKADHGGSGPDSAKVPLILTWHKNGSYKPVELPREFQDNPAPIHHDIPAILARLMDLDLPYDRPPFLTIDWFESRI